MIRMASTAGSSTGARTGSGREPMAAKTWSRGSERPGSMAWLVSSASTAISAAAPATAMLSALRQRILELLKKGCAPNPAMVADGSGRRRVGLLILIASSKMYFRARGLTLTRTVKTRSVLMRWPVGTASVLDSTASSDRRTAPTRISALSPLSSRLDSFSMNTISPRPDTPRKAASTDRSAAAAGTAVAGPPATRRPRNSWRRISGPEWRGTYPIADVAGGGTADPGSAPPGAAGVAVATRSVVVPPVTGGGAWMRTRFGDEAVE
mmetsp:Transcript_2900/g.8728  ORF Transcript_2900/g.8728 Transcript_2900/m.8728 type:complete len:266 (+) Transcript_2900:1756-2553(+)